MKNKYSVIMIIAFIFICMKYFFYAISIANANVNFTFESNPQAYCLAQNIYYETRGSNYADQLAVSYVVLNRVKSNKYPNTICGVVKQAKMGKNGLPIKNKCQFSWYCDGRSDYPTDRKSWERAKRTAMYVLNSGDPLDITEGATHYHAWYVKPYWASSLEFIGTIGQHIYYR